MIFTDTHTHQYLDAFDEDLEESIERATENNVKRIFLPNIDLESIARVDSLVARDNAMFFPMMGLHPCSVNSDYKEVLVKMKQLLDAREYVAVGEIGIDLYWDKSTLPIQVDAFKIQIQWAKDKGLPIVIHARDSFNEIFEVIEQMNDERLFGIFHCFTGNKEQANRIIGFGGFKMGIGGVVTFKNSKLGETIKDLDLKHFVLETDSPYLTPTPFRGKRNESSYIPYIAGKLSEIFNLPIEEIARITTENSKDVFSC